jgi:superfamily I DNA and RNA helicase
VTAHALGSGIYRAPNLVQHPDDPGLWGDIGYAVTSGELTLGQPVILERHKDASPQFFFNLINPNEAVKFSRYNSATEQFVAVAAMIKENLTKDELYPHDIVVVFPNSIDAEKRGMLFRQYLADQGIESHIVGVTSSKDSFSREGMVAITGPFRAKGNEAPVVYLMDADWCASGTELIKKRNILFTAITRSRAWVHVCGVGEGMSALLEEFESLKNNEYKLNFKIPTAEELRQMRTLYRDLTSDDKKKADDFRKAFEKIAGNQADTQVLLQTLPKETIEQMLRALLDVDKQ